MVSGSALNDISKTPGWKTPSASGLMKMVASYNVFLSGRINGGSDD
jgi:hypothetical protein